MYTLGQASKITGKPKTSIQRAIEKGRIKGVLRDKDGYRIPPKELFKVFAPLEGVQLPILVEVESPSKSETGGITGGISKGDTVSPDAPELGGSIKDIIRIKELEIKLDTALKRIEDLERDRNLWRDEVNSWKQQANALTATIAMLEEKHQQQFGERRRGFFKRWFGEN